MSTLQFNSSARQESVPAPLPPTPKQIEQAKRRKSFRDDVLYYAGAVLVTLGLGEIRIYLAPIALGCFCLLTPLLGLAQSFLRGIRASGGRR